MIKKNKFLYIDPNSELKASLIELILITIASILFIFSKHLILFKILYILILIVYNYYTISQLVKIKRNTRFNSDSNAQELIKSLIVVHKKYSKLGKQNNKYSLLISKVIYLVSTISNEFVDNTQCRRANNIIVNLLSSSLSNEFAYSTIGSHLSKNQDLINRLIKKMNRKNLRDEIISEYTHCEHSEIEELFNLLDELNVFI